MRFGVTPEFPRGTYAYFLTIEPDGTPRFPNIIGRSFFGVPSGGSVNAIGENVNVFVRGGKDADVHLTTTVAGGTATLVWDSVEGAVYRIEGSSDGSTWATLATGVKSSGGDTTRFSTTTIAANYRVTLTELAPYDAGTPGANRGRGASGQGPPGGRGQRGGRGPPP